ncbi:hypothetical protein M231_04591 [Tremella mesenterica]|uniref:Uncharacterized protein n=1 Tax=Tremella mesenterica TaxID=5217 RepID=A0A4Q1BKF8_TREME|nr:hypothetical protein M231_04591 [Tremella mesenterica]
MTWLKYPHLTRYKTSDLDLDIYNARKDIQRAEGYNDSLGMERGEQEKRKAEWRKKKKEEEVRPHPALQWGPISQTVVIMCLISLAMSVTPLPPGMEQFYRLFSRLSICSVVCLVGYTSLIWYGYTQALEKIPKPPSKYEVLHQKLSKMRERPDDWAHTRSHPSHFLTTRHAAPRLFPFPLGKTGPDAKVKDELWWEGGNAPHVGHFNYKPPPGYSNGPDATNLIERFKVSLEIEQQATKWKKRYRAIQSLCAIIIIAFVNKKIAVACLCYLTYHVFSTEVENMLKPPVNMEDVNNEIDQLMRAGNYRNESAPKPVAGMTGGMSYIYDPTDLSSSRRVAAPIHAVPPHVLMTTENHFYAGPGETFKAP